MASRLYYLLGCWLEPALFLTDEALPDPPDDEPSAAPSGSGEPMAAVPGKAGLDKPASTSSLSIRKANMPGRPPVPRHDAAGNDQGPARESGQIRGTNPTRATFKELKSPSWHRHRIISWTRFLHSARSPPYSRSLPPAWSHPIGRPRSWWRASASSLPLPLRGSSMAGSKPKHLLSSRMPYCWA